MAATAAMAGEGKGAASVCAGATGVASLAEAVSRTTAAGVGVYGNLRTSPVALDAAAGYTVDFSLQLLSESHASANRAGFSLVLVGHDPRQSLELSFWRDRVWAADYVALDPDRFVQAINISFSLSSLAMALGLWRIGLLTGDTLAVSVAGLAPVFLGTWLGAKLRRRLRTLPKARRWSFPRDRHAPSRTYLSAR